MNSPENFFTRVHQVVAAIPRGKVMTYGQIARILGNPRASRAVGFALHVNTDPQKVPCHRVVDRFGQVASGFGMGGPEVQKQRLEAEGVILEKEKVNLEKYLFHSRQKS